MLPFADANDTFRAVNPAALHRELTAAGLPVVGVADADTKAQVRIDWQQTPTLQQLEQAALIVAAHDKEMARIEAQERDERQEQAREAYRQLQILRGMTPGEAEAWVQINVTDLASAKTALKLMARLLVILARVGDLEDS